jgi:cephalosporin-C deacetylase-like acetyl esterase
LEAVNAIEDAMANDDWVSAYRGFTALPDAVEDSVRARLLEEATISGTVASDPAGARLAWRPLLEPETPWGELGTTPVTTYFPRDDVLFRLELEGHESRFLWSRAGLAEFTWPLQPAGSELRDALWVPGRMVNPGVLAGGIWQGDARQISDYLLDRFEVTNREFQQFVDAGGYERPELWEHEFEGDGERLDFEEAMALFADRTGQPGPSTWEIAQYVEGTGDHPVTGVSWYEAAAYARFVGRDLPTMYHWYRAAWVTRGQAVVPLSNLDGEALAPVGEYLGLTEVGASDMAGNAREWVMNSAGEYRLTQGGGWSDPVFSFGLAQPLSPLDRSEVNGFRLITDLGDGATLAAAGAPVAYFERDFSLESPASDEVFAVFRDLYAYDPTPLNAVIEATDTVDAGVVRQRISFDAAYQGERMVLHLYLPPGEVETPLQTVLYFPGSGYFNSRSFAERVSPQSTAGTVTRFVTRSGRALAFPMYMSTFERNDDFVYPLQDESNDYRDHVILWYQDLARSLDYLETRPDVDSEKFSYFGHSWGGRMGSIMLALESRFRVGVLYVAGFSPKPTQPAVDPFNFAPRVRVPVRIVSGQFDPIFPLEPSARPLFEALGDIDKDHYIAAGAHFVPWPELAQQSLDWLDRYLGPAGR